MGSRFPPQKVFLYIIAASFILTASFNFSSLSLTSPGGLFTGSTSTTSSPPTVSPGPIMCDNALILYWPFDEQTGDAVVYDWRNHHDASVFSPFPGRVPGRVHSALSMSNTEYTQLWTTPAVDFGAGDSFTIETFLSMGAPPGAGVPILNHMAVDSSGLYTGYRLLLLQTGQVQFELYTKAKWNNPTTAIMSNKPVVTGFGQFHHLVIVRDRSPRSFQVRLYVDGKLDASTTDKSGSLIYSGPYLNHFVLYGATDPTSRYSMYWDEFTLWKKALSATDISNHYQNAQLSQRYCTVCDSREWCDVLDNNCNAQVDEGGVCPSCDNDADGYTGIWSTCGGTDCDDSDASIHPGAGEVCTDTRDNDCDGATDCADTDCATDSACFTAVPSIAYQVSYSDLKVASYVTSGGNCAGGAWQCDVIETPNNVGAYLSIDKQGSAAAVSHYDNSNGDLRYASYVGTGGNCGNSAWQCDAIDTSGTVGFYTSVAFDSNSHVGISYTDWGNQDLKYATPVSSGGNCGPASSWLCTTIDSTGSTGLYTSLGFDAQDQPHISYFDSTNGYLKHAYLTSGSWTTEVIDNGNYTNNSTNMSNSTSRVGSYSSLVLDSAGTPYISYHDESSGSLRFAWYVGSGGNCFNPAWNCEAVDTDNAGWYSSVGLWGSTPIISYFRFSSGDLRVAVKTPGNCGSGNWQCDTLDSTGTTGQKTSLRSGPTPLISYEDYTNNDLKLASYVGSGAGNCGPTNDWSCLIIESGGSVGSYTSIA